MPFMTKAESFSASSGTSAVPLTVYQHNGEAPISATGSPISEEWSILMPDGSKATFSKSRVEQFPKAARNAMSAGFDGVEIHAAHRHLIGQFLKDGVNNRKDEYGGPVEKRCRFAVEVVEAVVKEIGEERTAIRLSPAVDHIGATDSDLLALAHHLVHLPNRHPLAYLHVTEPRFTREGLKQEVAEESGKTVAEIWSIVRGEYRGRLMRSGGYTRQTAMDAISTGNADMIPFGRLFISNSDLLLRFAIEVNLNKYDKSTFYSHDQVVGYRDYPFYVDC